MKEGRKEGRKRELRKYQNIPTIVDGIQFDSRKEATRYQELLLLLKAGKIGPINLQVAFPMSVNGRMICTYYADFQYFDIEKQCDVVEDVKSEATRKNAVYRLKAKLVKAIYNIDIVEV